MVVLVALKKKKKYVFKVPEKKNLYITTILLFLLYEAYRGTDSNLNFLFLPNHVLTFSYLNLFPLKILTSNSYTLFYLLEWEAAFVNFFFSFLTITVYTAPFYF